MRALEQWMGVAGGWMMPANALTGRDGALDGRGHPRRWRDRCDHIARR